MAGRKLEKHLTRQFEQQVARSSVEREQKYRIADARVVRHRLLELGATPHASGFERNELFDRDGWLSERGRRLRLRRHGCNGAVLTLKGPRLRGAHKARMEVETPVEYGAAKRILELLGFRINGTYTKQREEYWLEGCQVCLDHLPECGWFVEIEGKRKEIVEIARRLGLRPADREVRSYRKLIKQHAKLAGYRMAAWTTEELLS
jgi:predicted adenylyl cyclase CyaB